LDIGNREETPAASPVTLRLEHKHLLAIRWMHWINFPLLFIMILSGIRIYWNDSDNAHLHPPLSIALGWVRSRSSGFSRSQSGTRCMFRGM
jgi:hypothetical protein